jgi:CrcB protein
MRWIAIAVGGAAGAVTRWSVGYALIDVGIAFPAGTLAVNLIGALALGWLYGRIPEQAKHHPLYQGAATGFLGAFTTMSAFGLDSWLLLEGGRFGWAAIYIGSSAAVGPWLAGVGWRQGARPVSASGERAS